MFSSELYLKTNGCLNKALWRKSIFTNTTLISRWIDYNHIGNKKLVSCSGYSDVYKLFNIIYGPAFWFQEIQFTPRTYGSLPNSMLDKYWKNLLHYALDVILWIEYYSNILYSLHLKTGFNLILDFLFSLKQEDIQYKRFSNSLL